MRLPLKQLIICWFVITHGSSPSPQIIKEDAHLAQEPDLRIRFFAASISSSCKFIHDSRDLNRTSFYTIKFQKEAQNLIDLIIQWLILALSCLILKSKLNYFAYRHVISTLYTLNTIPFFFFFFLPTLNTWSIGHSCYFSANTNETSGNGEQNTKTKTENAKM
jgi:hypothetical protein